LGDYFPLSSGQSSVNGVPTLDKDFGGLPMDGIKLIIVQVTGHVEIRKGQ
jgi:hypothetical protein